MEKKKEIDVSMEKRAIDGMPHDKKNVDALKESIAMIEEGIRNNERKKELLAMRYRIMAKSPKDIEVKYEFQNDPEWVEYLRAQYELDSEFKQKEVEIDIMGLKQQREILLAQLEDE